MKCILKIIVISFISCSCFAHEIDTSDEPCHPKIDESTAQYIIGYGSLIQTQSKNKTHPKTGDNLPVIVRGYDRKWNARGIKNNITYLGIARNPSSEFNGVIFKLNHSDSIHEYDKREAGYCRILVNQNDVSMMSRSVLPDAQFWIYIPKKEFNFEPSTSFPITQSYVDIFLAGCIEIENQYHIQNYAFQCIDTTSAWSVNWVNDRDRSRYIEKPSSDEVKLINFLLSTKLPSIFNEVI